MFGAPKCPLIMREGRNLRVRRVIRQGRNPEEGRSWVEIWDRQLGFHVKVRARPMQRARWQCPSLSPPSVTSSDRPVDTRVVQTTCD